MRYTKFVISGCIIYKILCHIIMLRPRWHFRPRLRCSFKNVHIYQMINQSLKENITTFVICVFHLTGDLFKINIPKKNNNSHRWNDSPIGNIGHSKNHIGNIFPKGEWYFLQEFASDKYFSYRKLRFLFGFYQNEISVRSSCIPIGKFKFPIGILFVLWEKLFSWRNLVLNGKYLTWLVRYNDNKGCKLFKQWSIIWHI